MSNLDTVYLCGIRFNALTHNDLFNNLESFKQVSTVNAEFIVRAQKNKRFRDIINSNYSTIDGQFLYFLLKLKYPRKRFAKISGCDFIYDLCQFSKNHDKRIFLLGGYEKSNSLAVDQLRKLYEIEIQGFSPEFKPYPFDKEHNNKIIQKIQSFSPDILLVGFGAYKQEMWINDNKEILEASNVKIAIGVGGTFDYIAGRIKRAPRFFQVAGLEIFYRLYAEPSKVRLKRIFLSFRIFKYLIFDFFRIKTNK